MKDYLLAAALALLCFGIYRHSRITQGYDSRWSLYVAQSLLHEGNLNIDEYREEIINDDRYGIRKKQGHLYNFFPVGTSLLVAPLLWLTELPLIPSEKIVGCFRPESRSESGELTLHSTYQCVEREYASMLVALTAAILFLACGLFCSRYVALASAGLFAFATSAYSIASRALWQHGPTMLCLSLAIYIVLRSRKMNDSWWWLAAAPLGFSYWVRPSNSISILAFSLWALYTHRAKSWKFLCLLAIVLIPFAALNQALYSAWLPPYYKSSRLELSVEAPLIFVAQWLSPSRGLLIFSPFLLWALFEGLRSLKTREDPLRVAFVGILMAHSIVLALFPHWWGGHTFGPRLMSDMLPYLTVLLACNLSRSSWSTSPLFLFVFVASCLFSAQIHARGANSRQPYAWNLSPHNVDETPERVWSWSDPQWAR